MTATGLDSHNDATDAQKLPWRRDPAEPSQSLCGAWGHRDQSCMFCLAVFPTDFSQLDSANLETTVEAEWILAFLFLRKRHFSIRSQLRHHYVVIQVLMGHFTIFQSHRLLRMIHANNYTKLSRLRPKYYRSVFRHGVKWCHEYISSISGQWQALNIDVNKMIAGRLTGSLHMRHRTKAVRERPKLRLPSLHCNYHLHESLLTLMTMKCCLIYYTSRSRRLVKPVKCSSVHPCSVNLFKSLLGRRRWNSASIFYGLGTQLVGSGIWNFGPCAVHGHPGLTWSFD